MMKFSRSLRDRFQALRTPKRFILSSAEFLRIFGALISTLKARAGSLRSITFLGSSTCPGSSLACSCSPSCAEPTSFDYSGHQPGDSDRNKSRRKL